jgi:hypothetical protein
MHEAISLFLVASFFNYSKISLTNEVRFSIY